MDLLVKKLVDIEKAISGEKGNFVLFALLSRDKEKGLWDLVISAEWFGSDQKKTLDYIIPILQKELTSEELTQISRVVLLSLNDPLVRNINTLIKTEHSNIEFTNVRINDLWLDHMIVITSKRTGNNNGVYKSKSSNDLKAIKA